MNRISRSLSAGRARWLAFLLAFAACSTLPAATQVPPATESAVQVAPGVTYRHLVQRTPTGEPWSIHVLKVERGEKSVVVRAVEAHGAQSEMQRNLPTEMATRAASEGHEVLAVVNGDYDLSEPYLGIPVGLSITSGRLWTSARPGRPVFGLLGRGKPAIGAPEVRLELSAGGPKWSLAALNKPIDRGLGDGPRLFTRQFRAAAKSEQPVRAVVIGQLSPALPLPVDGVVRGVVTRVEEPATEVAIPADALVVTFPTGGGEETLQRLQPGRKVKLRIRIRLGGKRGVQDAIGGFPVVAENGQPRIVGEPSNYLRLRHPRTAACFNPREIIFAVVDGRQPQLSVGMTLGELAGLMVSLGCTVAMNTDGGGSSVMAVALPGSGAETGAPSLRIVNSPSDGQERGRGNAWLVLRQR